MGQAAVGVGQMDPPGAPIKQRKTDKHYAEIALFLKLFENTRNEQTHLSNLRWLRSVLRRQHDNAKQFIWRADFFRSAGDKAAGKRDPWSWHFGTGWDESRQAGIICAPLAYLHKIIERRNLKESTKAPKPRKQGKTEENRGNQGKNALEKIPRKRSPPKREPANKEARSSEPDCTFECTNYAGGQARSTLRDIRLVNTI